MTAATTTLLATDTATWGVVIAAIALVVSVYGAVVATLSAGSAQRSADAAEETAKATASAAEASGRAAAAAESSAQHAGRSAEAAERSATAEERGVELHEERARHERRERVERDAPRWEPLGEHETAWWVSDANNLRGVLVNAGQVEARVTSVELCPANGGLVVGRFRAEPQGPVSGGFRDELAVRPGAAMAVEFTTTDGSLGAVLEGGVAPRVEITASADELAWKGTRTLELLRRPGGAGGAIRWQPRAVG